MRASLIDATAPTSTGSSPSSLIDWSRRKPTYRRRSDTLSHMVFGVSDATGEPEATGAAGRIRGLNAVLRRPAGDGRDEQEEHDGRTRDAREG